MGLVSVRLDDADERFIREHKLRISDIVRDAVHVRVQQLRAAQDLDFLQKVRWSPQESSDETVRRLRDARPVRD